MFGLEDGHHQLKVSGRFLLDFEGISMKRYCGSESEIVLQGISND
jgi:hypothetical protein